VIRYRQTQVVWPAVVPLVAIMLPLGLAFGWAHLTGPLVVIAVATVLILLLFATMTVTVNDGAIDARFGIGLVGKRVPFDRIRSCQVVRNPWYYGWGIHFIPGGMLYNASGLSAIELRLTNGRCLRIGSGEPDVLAAALRRAAPTVSDQILEPGSTSKAGIYIGLGTAAMAVAIAAFAIYSGMQPPVVEVTPESFSVRNGLYSSTIPFRQITSATLDERIPRVGLKTNGFAAGSTLRGTFRVDSWGSARLYVNLDSPPFVVIRSPDGIVAVNFQDPERTREMYAQLRQSMDRSR
jgi:PH (Pleckstrin Homology) domain-containing protein